MTSEMLEQLDLSQGALGQDLLREDIGNLLDRYTFLGLTICCGAGEGLVSSALSTTSQDQQNVPDNTISTLSQLLCDGVSLVDNEVLVEDLEDLSSL